MPYDLLSFLLLRTKKKANIQFNRKLLTSLFIGQYNVEKTQTSPPHQNPESETTQKTNQRQSGI